MVTDDETVAVPAFAVEVVDTPGCGDAFSAGFLRGLAAGKDLRRAAVMGSATAAIVAQGLTTGHGTSTSSRWSGLRRRRRDADPAV